MTTDDKSLPQDPLCKWCGYNREHHGIVNARCFPGSPEYFEPAEFRQARGLEEEPSVTPSICKGCRCALPFQREFPQQKYCLSCARDLEMGGDPKPQTREEGDETCGHSHRQQSRRDGTICQKCGKQLDSDSSDERPIPAIVYQQGADGICAICNEFACSGFGLTKEAATEALLRSVFSTAKTRLSLNATELQRLREENASLLRSTKIEAHFSEHKTNQLITERQAAEKERDQLRAENAQLRIESAPAEFPDGAPIAEVLNYLLECARGWMPDARIIGNLRAGDIVRAIEGQASENDALTQTVASLREALEPFARRFCKNTAADNVSLHATFPASAYKKATRALSAAPESDWVKRSELAILDAELDAVLQVLRKSLGNEMNKGHAPAESVALIVSQRDDLRAKLATAKAERDDIAQKTREECASAAEESARIMMDTIIQPQFDARDKELRVIHLERDRMKDRLGKIRADVASIALDGSHVCISASRVKQLEKWASEGLGE